MSLRVITAPAAEPVSVATVKSHLRIDLSDEDTLLASYIKGAREQGELLSRQAFITQTLEQTFEGWPPDYVLKLWRPPLQSVTSVKYYDEDNVEATWTDYTADTNSEPGAIHFNSFPSVTLRESGGVVVRFVAGYDSDGTLVPERFKQLMLQLIGHWYEHRESMAVPKEIRDAFRAERVIWF